MNGYVLLSVAVAAEVIATTALKAADGFSRPGPSALVVAGYVVAFVMLAQVVRTVPLGVAYAIWSGLGIVGTSVLGFWLYGQRPDVPALAGMALIVLGVVVINVFSSATGH